MSLERSGEADERLDVREIDGEPFGDIMTALEDLSAGESLFIQYTVERVQQETESDSLLTERQQWLLDEAIERGYYDTPRRTTLVDLADELDIAKSTCSEILHRAEERVLKEYRNDDRNGLSEIVAASD